MQLDYLDLYLIHQPFGDVYGEWRAMQDLYKEGGVKAIGVSNFHSDRLIDLIIHNEIVPTINQVETHPFHQQIETQKFLQENNVQMESGDRLQKVKTISSIMSCLLPLEKNIINQLHKLLFAGSRKEAL